jgi:hypothetical protein
MHSLRAYPSSSISAALALALALLIPGCDSGSTNPNGDDDGSGDQDGGGADAYDTPNTHDDGGGCPAVNVTLQPVVPTVLLLLDQSGSMDTAFGGGLDRYQAMMAALVAPTTGVVTQLQDSVIFGATLYTSHNGNTGGTCPLLDSVPPALNNYDAIQQLLADNGPDGDTPTGESILGAMHILQGVAQDPDAPPSPKIIVLATDGEPDTCAVPNPQTGQSQAISAAQTAFAAGFPLFILSVGNEVGAAHQQDMANAGAGKPINHSQGDAPFYNASNPAELKSRFNEIINGVRDCTFAISDRVDASQAADGTVKLNDQPLVFNDPNGWTLVDEHTLKLNGSACQTFLDDPTVSLSAEFPCGVIIP